MQDHGNSLTSSHMAVCQTSDAAGPPGELDRMAPNWAAIGSAGPQNEPQSLHDHVQSGAEYHIGLGRPAAGGSFI